MTAHSWSAWTDGGDGSHVRSCADCDGTQSAAHVWNDPVQTKIPTCKETGADLYTCTVCDAQKTETVALDPANHADYGTHLENTVAATCTQAGYTGDTVCNGCGVKLADGETVAAHDHHYVLVPEKSQPADYDVEGFDYYECTYDDAHYYTTVVPALIRPTFNVTFVADGTTVAVVPYLRDAAFVEEPVPPEKDNYTVEWEEYTLNNTDLTVNAVYTPIDPNNVSEVQTEKTVNGFANGNATITLSAAAASRLVKFESTSTKPVDVILVLDLSGSMAEKLGASERTKLQALKDCTNTFLTALNNNAVATGADHRVALVGFASGQAVSGYSMTAYKNTGLLLTQTTGFVSYTNAASSYDKALMPTGNLLGVDARLTAAVNGLTADGSTNTHLGLKMAQNILAQTGGDGREKVVVLITDGNPTSAGSHRDEIQSVAPSAVTYANEIKALGVKLYTVGVDASADANAPFDGSVDGVTGTGAYDVINNRRKEVVDYDFNRFLNIVSSNYPSAQSMNDWGERENDGYYMSVNNTDSLNDIFSKILVSSVYKKLSFYRCTLVDTLSDDFVLTMEQEDALRQRLADEYDLPDGSVSVSRNADGTTTIRLTGVPAVKTVEDGRTFYRASVTFEAALRRWQAGVYETNTEDAYVEADGEQTASFAVPPAVTVESDRNIVVFKLNGEIYRIEEGAAGDPITAPVCDYAAWTIPADAVITGNYAEFEATDVSQDQYAVIWDIDGIKTVETYTFGEEIAVPQAPEKEGLTFYGFVPQVPQTMPARDLTFTAVYTEKHTHVFKQTGVRGSCTEGLTLVSECVCGETKEERLAAREHQFSAVVGDVEGNTLTDTIVCAVCHRTEQHTLTFKTRANGNGRMFLDLSLEENGTLIQPAEGSSVKIMIPWTSQGNAGSTVRVYRVNEEGVQKTYNATVENGYLVFYADHFSMYVVEETEALPAGQSAAVSYQAAVCDLNGTHSYEAQSHREATCTADGFVKYVCPECGGSYTQTLPAAGHKDGTGDGKCDVCGADLNGAAPQEEGDVCKYCHQVHENNFIGKITKFFHSVAYFFAHLFGKM